MYRNRQYRTGRSLAGLLSMSWLMAWVLVWGSIAQAKLNVVATTADFGALAAQIGGAQVEVVTLAKPTEDPHFVDAKPSFILKLNRADALIEGGADLEAAWLAPLVSGARNSKILPGRPGRIVCTHGIGLLEVPAELDRSKGDLHASGNPHYTTDPVNARMVAEHIAEAFCALDPKASGTFRDNLRVFKSALEPKVQEWEKLMAPHRGKSVVTYHNYWPYFAKRFGLKMDLFLEPKPGIPPSPAHLADVVSRMKAERARVILVQPYLNRKIAETAANLAGGKVLDVAAYPAIQKGETYIGWMDGLVRSVAGALSAAEGR